MTNHRITSATAISALIVGAVAGCGAAAPSRELLDARAAYQQAAAGPAAERDPAGLHVAKTSLSDAERASADDATSDRARALAYVAQRRAEQVQVRANMLGELQQKQEADQQKQALTLRGLQNAESDLSRSNAALAMSKQDLATSQGQLVLEKAAREAAERRARDAMDKLAIASSLAVKDEKRGTVITLPGNVLFTTAKWDLLPAAQTKLATVADALKDQEDHKIVVEGHTDSQGTPESNLTLGQNRADSVRQYLVARGIPENKISAVGIGQARPIADNTTVEGRAQNRRVEIIVQPVETR